MCKLVYRPRTWVAHQRCPICIKRQPCSSMEQSFQLPPGMQRNVLEAVRCVSLGKNTMRFARKPNARLLGLTWSVSHGTTVAQTPDWAPHYLEVIVSVVRHFFPEFRYTTVITNHNFPGHLHMDSVNVGPSVMITVWEEGGGTGGELWYDGRVVPTAGWILHFDGNMPHMTLPYRGTVRYSIVCYTDRRWHRARPSREVQWALCALGLPVPPLTHDGGGGFPPRSKMRLLATARDLIKQQVRKGLLSPAVLPLLTTPLHDMTIRRHQREARRAKAEAAPQKRTETKATRILKLVVVGGDVGKEGKEEILLRGH